MSFKIMHASFYCVRWLYFLKTPITDIWLRVGCSCKPEINLNQILSLGTVQYIVY